MIEIDATGQPRTLRALDDAALLDLAGHSTIQRRRADRTRLRVAVDWARRHPTGYADTATWAELDHRTNGTGTPASSQKPAGCENQKPDGMEELELLEETVEIERTGSAVPGVTPGAIADLGTAMSLTTRSATILVEDALDLTFRLPKLHAQVEALAVDISKARHVARLTHNLSDQAAAFVDDQIGATLARKTWKAIEQAVAMAIHIYHPDLAKQLADKGKASWRVQVQHPDYVDFNGTSHLAASADSLDLEDFMAAIGAIAEELGTDGDTDTLDQRKAKALGILARQATGRPERPPAHDPTTDFLPDEAAPHTDNHDPDHIEFDAPDTDAADGDAGDTGDAGNARDTEDTEDTGDAGDTGPKRGNQSAGAPAARLARLRSRRPIVVHAHITEHLTHDGTVETRTLYEVPGYGIAAEDVFNRWCQTHKIRAHRVIDLNRTDALDHHDPPESLRAAVKERDRHCVFPHCATDAELCDLDHITAYDPTGPPGQTSLDALACLCRRHHLLKTHAGWTYHRAPDGTYVWTSPHGLTYLVTTTGETHSYQDAA